MKGLENHKSHLKLKRDLYVKRKWLLNFIFYLKVESCSDLLTMLSQQLKLSSTLTVEVSAGLL